MPPTQGKRRMIRPAPVAASHAGGADLGAESARRLLDCCPVPVGELGAKPRLTRNREAPWGAEPECPPGPTTRPVEACGGGARRPRTHSS